MSHKHPVKRKTMTFRLDEAVARRIVLLGDRSGWTQAAVLNLAINLTSKEIARMPYPPRPNAALRPQAPVFSVGLQNGKVRVTAQ